MSENYPVSTANTPDEAGGSTVGPNENTGPENTQQDQNISILGNTNMPPVATPEVKSGPESWKGDPRYFQTGKKAGKLKPSTAVSGVDSTSAASTEFEGLNTAALKASAQHGGKVVEAALPEEKKKLTKAEKKLVEAKIGAKLAMRMLDTLVNWISKGQYGAHFTGEQAGKRNEYRSELEQDWQDYLATLDIPMHPGLVVAFGSLNYVADAFNTPAGQERATSLKVKIFGKVIGSMFGRKK